MQVSSSMTLYNTVLKKRHSSTVNRALDWLLVLNQLIPRHPETDRVIKHEIKGMKSIVINRKLMLLCYRNCQSSVTFRTKRESWRTKERPWERRLLPYRPHPESHKANCACVTKQNKKKKSSSAPNAGFKISMLAHYDAASDANPCTQATAATEPAYVRVPRHETTAEVKFLSFVGSSLQAVSDWPNFLDAFNCGYSLPDWLGSGVVLKSVGKWIRSLRPFAK